MHTCAIACRSTLVRHKQKHIYSHSHLVNSAFISATLPHQIVALHCALSIAIVLNRTLILPYFSGDVGDTTVSLLGVLARALVFSAADAYVCSVCVCVC